MTLYIDALKFWEASTPFLIIQITAFPNWRSEVAKWRSVGETAEGWDTFEYFDTQIYLEG